MEILANQLTGLMDMKIFYKGKNAGETASLFCLPRLGLREGAAWGPSRLRERPGSLPLCCHDDMHII